MSGLYDRLRGTAGKLLSKYKQGTVEIGTETKTQGATEYDPPTVTTEWQEIDAVVSGVSVQYVDNVNIVSSDREVMFQGTIGAGQKVRIDGQIVTVLRLIKIPAAGEPVATIAVVRG
jgi:hypothetical protein